jgi:hypothetical protein
MQEDPDGARARRGWVIFDGDSTPVGGTIPLKEDFLDWLLPREQQIFCCEACAGWIVPCNHEDLFRGRDVLWWIDNEGAASSLVRGRSRQFDAGSLVHLAHLKWAELGCRVWIEWINSDSNPSDGLSRAGLLDPWTLRQGWSLRQGFIPAADSLTSLVGSAVETLLPQRSPSG